MATKKQPRNILQDRNARGKLPTQLHIVILKQMLTLATSGFGLVAALAWNNVIQEFVTTQIKPFLPQGSGLISLFIYAIIVTILVVIVTYHLSVVIEKLESKK